MLTRCVKRRALCAFHCSGLIILRETIVAVFSITFGQPNGCSARLAPITNHAHRFQCSAHTQYDRQNGQDNFGVLSGCSITSKLHTRGRQNQLIYAETSLMELWNNLFDCNNLTNIWLCMLNAIMVRIRTCKCL